METGEKRDRQPTKGKKKEDEEKIPTFLVLPLLCKHLSLSVDRIRDTDPARNHWPVEEEMNLRVRARLSGMLSQLLAPKVTVGLEYACLAVAVALLCLLVVLHTNFVQQPRCSGELSGINITGAQLVQIKIGGEGLWTEDTTGQEMNFQNKSSSTESSVISDMNGFSMILKYLLKENTAWKVIVDTPKFLQMLHVENLKAIIVQWLDKRSKASEATYLYTAEKGYLLLSEGEKSRQNIKTVNATLFAQSFCFGNRWQQVLINTFVGYDTILMNSLLSSPGHGHLYNSQTKEFYDLNHGEGSEGSTRFGDYFVRKSGVLIMSLFIFFTTTMPVSFILRETESRTLKLTVQLHHHAHFHLPTFQLIFAHATESLSSVPIMIGTLFFLSKLYNSELLAFLVLILVWLSEVFTLISARTSISMQFFPQFFLLYFLIFHIYLLSFPYGFSYLAFSATVAFVLHLILCFWNHFEVPTLSEAQFASTTHSTSSVQNASINMPSSEMGDYDTGDHELPTSFEIPLRSDSAVPDTLEPIELPEAQEFSDSSTQQTEAAPEYSLSNPSGSLFILRS